MKNAAGILLCCFLALMCACGITGRGNGDDNYFSGFVTFTDQEWPYGRTLDFRVDTLADSVAHGGTLLLSLRHTAGYQYGNIWLELEYPMADTTLKDTFNIALATSLGHWRGHGSGPSRQFTDTLKTNFTLYRGDTLKLRHIMRCDTLTNIEQIGVVYNDYEQF